MSLSSFAQQFDLFCLDKWKFDESETRKNKIITKWNPYLENNSPYNS